LHSALRNRLFRTKQALWLAVHQGQLERIRELERELELEKEKRYSMFNKLDFHRRQRAQALAELQRQEAEADALLYTLHDLTNGAAFTALELYEAGELLPRISDNRRRRLHRWIREAEATMQRDSGYVSDPLGAGN